MLHECFSNQCSFCYEHTNMWMICCNNSRSLLQMLLMCCNYFCEQLQTLSSHVAYYVDYFLEICYEGSGFVATCKDFPHTFFCCIGVFWFAVIFFKVLTHHTKRCWKKFAIVQNIRYPPHGWRLCCKGWIEEILKPNNREGRVFPDSLWDSQRYPRGLIFLLKRN
jgi:hypothetical protein